MVEGQESKHFAAPVIRADDAGIVLINGNGIQRLLADGFSVIGKDPAGTGGTAGAESDIFAPDGFKPDGPGRFLDHLEIDLTDIACESPGLQGNNLTAGGLIQEPLDDAVGSGSIQEEGIVPGTQDAPEKGRPLAAGIHGDADPAGLGCQGGNAGGIIVRPAGPLGIGAHHFLITLEPEGRGGIPVIPQNIKERGKGFVGLQPCADRQCILIGHHGLLLA